jgi:hypothetical protein
LRKQSYIEQGSKAKVDIGLLAETLFFYGRTHLLLDRGSLVSLVKLIPRSVLLDLFDMDAIQLSYVRQSFAVMASGAPVAYDFGAITLHGNVDGSKIRNHRDEIAETLARELGASRATQKFAQKITDRVALQRYRGLKRKGKGNSRPNASRPRGSNVCTQCGKGGLGAHEKAEARKMRDPDEFSGQRIHQSGG